MRERCEVRGFGRVRGGAIIVGVVMAMGTLRTVRRLEALFAPSRSESRS